MLAELPPPSTESTALSIPLSAYGPKIIAVSAVVPRCQACNRRLAEYVTVPYSIRCQSCRHENRVGSRPTGL